MLKTKKYIGGDFDASASERFEGKEFPVNTFFPQSISTLRRNFSETATDAFAAIIREVSSQTASALLLWYPAHYCIETIIRLEQKCGSISLNTKEYNDINKIAKTPGVKNILLFNHFNRYDNTVLELRGKFPASDWIIIEDFVHAPLDIQKTTGNYSFNSLRKLSDVEVAVSYGLSEGVMPASRPSEYFTIKKEAAGLKKEFFNTGNSALEEKYLSLFKKAENALNRKEIVAANKNELERLSKINWQQILEVRKQNYQLFKSLVEHHKDILFLPGDYMYMIVKVPNREALKKYMFSHGIFPVIHWPDSHDPIKHEILSFHIDQRYGQDDIKRTCDLVNSFYAS